MIDWIERESDAPPLDESLTDWNVTQRRRSHWNAVWERTGAYHLKWFFHSRRLAPAAREWTNARRIAELGIETVDPVGWGRHARGSFIVLRHAPGFPAAEWPLRGGSEASAAALAAQLAERVARLHRAGICHRDLNVYHVLVDGGDLRLIDVGRVRSFRRRRWIVKDLASLGDSAAYEGLPRSSLRAFLARYASAAGLSREERRRLVRSAARKARRYRRHNERHGR